MTGMKPMFQFSSFDDKTYIGKLSEAIRRLGGLYDESKIYSPNATHLIVEKIECTEKILCFIASGKWIITHTYLKRCLNEKKFLKEDDFHVSKRFKDSKLATVSLKWKDNISLKKENAPFFNWKVGCYIKDEEKAKALTRIIKAGYGSASLITPTTRKREAAKLTLLIYDVHTKESVMSLALQLKIPHYPFQAIPDYIMQCINSDSPVLPLSYYENHLSESAQNNTTNSTSVQETSTPEEQQIEKIPGTKLDEITDSEFMSSASYKTFLRCSNMHETKANTINQEIESLFFVLWQNNAFNEALNLLISLDSDEVPTSAALVAMLKFLMDNPIKTKNNFTYDSMDCTVHQTIYNSIYSYILNLLLNHPPSNTGSIKLYSEVFKNLDLGPKIWNANESYNSKCLIDILYLISLHDYLLFNSLGNNMKLEKSILALFQLDKNDVQKRLANQMYQDRNLTMPSVQKLLEIISFCNRYLKPNNFHKNLKKVISTEPGDREMHELMSYLGRQ